MAAVNRAPPEVRDQILVTSALPSLLPAGLVGLFCAIMMAALISSHNGFMHAWGGVLLQDIILPLRKSPLSTSAHLWALRGAIAFVGLVAFVYSLLWKPNQSILMYFAMVNNIWLGPAGAVMLGGLYWKKGTTKAAVTTLVTGTLLGIGFLVLHTGWQTWFHADFPLNGQWIFLTTIVYSIAVYGTVSLLDRKTDFNMQKMLHRGPYAIAGEKPPEHHLVKWWQAIFGITPMFDRRDRLTAYAIVGFFLFWLGVFIVGTAYGVMSLYDLVPRIPVEDWAAFWHAVYLSLFPSACW